ncbi:MAG: hypothetical protein ACI39Q_00645 [Wujia sp.]
MRSTSLSLDGLLIGFLPNVIFLYLIMIVLIVPIIYKLIKVRHKRGIDRFLKTAVIPVVYGIILIALGYFGMLSAMKYTHGTEKTIATVIDKDTKVSVSRSRGRRRSHRTYIYTLQYTDNNVEKKVKIRTKLLTKIDEGDTLEIYYVPDENDEDYNHTVVAVEFEKAYASKYLTVGMISCLFGLALLIIFKIRQDAIEKGLPTSARVIQISPSNSKLSGKKSEYVLICQGRNPVTQMIMNYTTTGPKDDFMFLENGSNVTVVVSKENPKSYMISV